MSQQLGRYYGGHRPDPDNHGMPGLEQFEKLRLAAVPNSFSLRDSVLSGPGILNQSQTGSCVGHATDGAIETRLAFLGTKVPHKSPLGIYDIARAMERADSNPNVPVAQLPALEDVGAIPSWAMKGLTDFGVPSYAQRPTVDAEVNDGPRLAQLEDGATFELKGAYRINATGSGLLLAIKQAISSGFPVPFAVQVDNAFENWTPGNAPITTPKGQILGGHYIYLIGYDTLATSKTVWTFANSWDVTWGDEGFAQGDDAFVQASTDLYVTDVHQVS